MQRHYMEMFTPVHESKLSRNDRADALAYLMLLVEKSDSMIKGWTCYNGINQQSYIKNKIPYHQLCPWKIL